MGKSNHVHLGMMVVISCYFPIDGIIISRRRRSLISVASSYKLVGQVCIAIQGSGAPHTNTPGAGENTGGIQDGRRERVHGPQTA